MYPIDLSDKHGIVFGIANHRSIAWAIAQILHDAGANLAIAYQNERVKNGVARLVEDWEGDTPLIECDVSDDANVEAAFDTVGDRFGSLDIAVHSIAYANRDDLGGPFMDTGREGFRLALDISAYSLLPYSALRLARSCSRTAAASSPSPFRRQTASSPATMSWALQRRRWKTKSGSSPPISVEQNIRVNAISAGPLDTLSSRVISHYRDMKRIHAERSPMRRNITTDEVAKAALFLCSDLSGGITGEILHVDTGYNIMGI